MVYKGLNGGFSFSGTAMTIQPHILLYPAKRPPMIPHYLSLLAGAFAKARHAWAGEETFTFFFNYSVRAS